MSIQYDLPDVRLRDFALADLPRLRDMVRRAWHATYHGIYTESYIDNFIDGVYTVEFHRSVLDAMERGRAYCKVAVREGEITGVINFLHSEHDSELMRLYLEPALIGRGVGSLLLEKAEAALRESGFESYHLYVHIRNMRGRRFYERKGLVAVPGKETDDELYLRKRLIDPA